MSEFANDWQTVFEARVTENAQFRFGVREKLLSRLLSNFEVSQGPLYHYTRLDIAKSISKGELWLTRADGFLDEREIEHGLAMLTSVIPNSWGSELAGAYRQLLSALREALTKSYVLSLSLDPDNAYLKKTYASENGAILELPSIFSFSLATGWHAVQDGDGYSLRGKADDIYDLVQGFVKYDIESQRRISVVASDVFKVLATKEGDASPESTVEFLHFRDALLQCLILFKEPKYQDEKEYRMALVLRAGVNESFEHIREVKGRTSSYIKLHLSPAEMGVGKILGLENAKA